MDDRRSKFIHYACGLIGEISKFLGPQFEPLSPSFISSLLPLLAVTISVIAVSVHSCIVELLPFSYSSLPVIVSGVKDKHKVVRARCVEYLCRIVETGSQEVVNTEGYVEELETWLSR